MCHCAGLLHRYKDSQINIKNGEHYVIHENGTLEIHVAQPLNSGKYTCIATNNLGVRENHVFLEVKGQADFGGVYVTCHRSGYSLAHSLLLPHPY